MEKSPSWSRAHDWKSCRLLKGLEGSNPSFSATNYKNCSFVISGKHLKLQWIKGLKRLSFKPFFWCARQRTCVYVVKVH